MKLKAAIAEGTPPALVEAFNNLRATVMAEVVGPHLHREEFGPAAFYVQASDFGDGSGGLFAEVRLTGVSRTRDRSEVDFEKARDALFTIYANLIKRFLPKGQRMQLMVTVMVDPPPSLVETDAIWIDGEAEPEAI